MAAAAAHHQIDHIILKMAVGPPQRKSTLFRILVFVGLGLTVIQVLLLFVGLSLQRQDALTNTRNQPGTFDLDEKVHRSIHGTETPDGFFNGHPIYFEDGHPSTYSSVHCVGENYQKDSWMHRSCHFSFLCFDTLEKDFVVFQPPMEKPMQNMMEQRPLMDLSQTFIETLQNNTVSLGGINLKWGMTAAGVPRLEWFPRIVSEKPPASFYTLPPDVVMIPFHSLSGANPGHLLWDEFLPFFTILGMFQLDGFEPLPIRFVLSGDRGLWASCDWTDKNIERCAHMHEKFFPVMTKNTKSRITTQKSPLLDLKNPRSNLICAKHGAAGIGALTDHGTAKFHGWRETDYETTHNHGRGSIFWKFRNFAMDNAGVVDQPLSAPFKIIFSEQSSSVDARNIDFRKHRRLLRNAFVKDPVSVDTYVFKDHSLKDQMEIASQAVVYVTVCGGGAATATFLPKGSTLIIFYMEDGGRLSNHKTYLPARLDWDLFNNLAYINVHWLPMNTMFESDDMKAFVQLVKHELAPRFEEASSLIP